MSQLKIFISYSWKDKAEGIMKSITNKLRDDNWDYWVDIHNLEHGQHINSAVTDAICEADLVLFMWSKNFAASAGCQFEVQTAFEHQKEYLPCCIDNYPLSNSLYLDGTKRLDFVVKTNGVSGLEWGWVKLRQQLLEIEAKLLGGNEISDELQDIRKAVYETGETFYRQELGASGNDGSHEFIKSMMLMGKMMAMKDSENGDKYLAFFEGVEKISAQYPNRADDDIKKEKLMDLIDEIDPCVQVANLFQLKCMTLLSMKPKIVES